MRTQQKAQALDGIVHPRLLILQLPTRPVTHCRFSPAPCLTSFLQRPLLHCPLLKALQPPHPVFALLTLPPATLPTHLTSFLHCRPVSTTLRTTSPRPQPPHSHTSTFSLPHLTLLTPRPHPPHSQTSPSSLFHLLHVRLSSFLQRPLVHRPPPKAPQLPPSLCSPCHLPPTSPPSCSVLLRSALPPFIPAGEELLVRSTITTSFSPSLSAVKSISSDTPGAVAAAAAVVLAVAPPAAAGGAERGCGRHNGA